MEKSKRTLQLYIREQLASVAPDHGCWCINNERKQQQQQEVGWQASQGKASQACCDKRQCLLAWSPTHSPEEEKSVQWRTWGWARMKVALLILLASLFLAEAKQRFPAKVIHCILIRTHVQLMLFRDHHFTFWWDCPIISRKFTAAVYFVMPLRYHCTYPYS